MGKVILSGVSKGMTVPKVGTPISEFAVGSTVKMNSNGIICEYLIVHKGLPSSLYDESCNGTWVLMKDCYGIMSWHDSNVNNYANSTINTFLNGTYYGWFNDDLKKAIKQVKIPYVNGTGGSSVASGTNGMTTKAFLLSGYEVGWTDSDDQYFPVDGAKLDYFIAGNATAAKNKRIAYLNGSATDWWLRSPYDNNTALAWYVRTDGSYLSNGYCANSFGIRPALILNSNALVDKEGNVTGV